MECTTLPIEKKVFFLDKRLVYMINKDTQAADKTVSSFVDSSAQHRGNEAKPGSNEKYIFPNNLSGDNNFNIAMNRMKAADIMQLFCVSSSGFIAPVS